MRLPFSWESLNTGTGVTCANAGIAIASAGISSNKNRTHLIIQILPGFIVGSSLCAFSRQRFMRKLDAPYRCGNFRAVSL
jgi:hypothetical protein